MVRVREGGVAGEVRRLRGVVVVVVCDLAVDGDEVEGDLAALGLVRAQDFRAGGAVDDGAEFPAEIVRVLHGDVHALTEFRGVGVDGVAGEEDSALSLFG